MHVDHPLELPELEMLTDLPTPEIAEDAAEIAIQWRAAWTVVASIAVGVLGNLLFYYFPLGINIPLFMTGFAAVMLGLLWYFSRSVSLPNITMLVPAVVFALLLSIITAPQLMMFNALYMAGALFIALRFGTTPRFMGGSWSTALHAAFETALIGWIEGPITLVSSAAGYLKHIELEQRQIAHLSSILRGLLLTVPVVGLFALLLSSADMVFGRLLMRTVAWISPDSADAIAAQVMMTAVFAWAALTGFRLVLHDDYPAPEPAHRRLNLKAEAKPFRVGMIEAGMLLGSVDALFALFMIIQARYLFGGTANITLEGYTYAEYARRGFYELLMVSVMTMLLALAINNITHRKREREIHFRALTGGMIGLTLLLLVAAYYRLHLYQDAYGFTRIRVMSGVFMFWLGALLVVLLVAILRRMPQWFWIGVLATSTGFVLSLNMMNMDGFIANHNITRYEDTGKLDVPYLLSLSDDAIPAVVGLLERPDLPTEMRETLLVGLGYRLYELDAARAKWDVLGYHFGKARAWRALDAHRFELIDYLRPEVRFGFSGSW